jgi:hypothetical protein
VAARWEADDVPVPGFRDAVLTSFERAITATAMLALSRTWSGGFAVVAALVASSACVSSAPSMEDGDSPAGMYTFCGALTATCKSASSGTGTACGDASRRSCSTFESTFSQAMRDAVVACAKKFSPCSAEFLDCEAIEVGKAPPTPAQAKVRADFCTVWPDDDHSKLCSDFFTVDAPKRDYGPGYSVLLVNDSIARDIALKCIKTPKDTIDEGGVPADASFGFSACARTVYQAATTPPECRPAGG